MKKVVYKSAVPLYAAAAMLLLYALLFPFYKTGHFIVGAAVSALAGLIAKAFCKDIVEEVPEEEPKPETTGNEELDKMILDCDLAIREMQRLDENIEDARISAHIVRLENLTAKICTQVKEKPEKLPQIRKFMNYYLPTTMKLLNAYDVLDDQGVAGENITSTMDRVSAMLDTIVAAFEKQLDSLFGAEALDISTDITVLENMMAREGLSDDPLHKAVNRTENSDSDEQSGGITLEL